MNKAINKIEHLIHHLAFDENQKSFYRKKAHTYYNECGCSLGGIFLAASLLCCIPYFIFVDHSWRTAWISFLFIFIASVSGKIIGIAIARIKLVLLCNSLLRRFNNLNKSHYVNMH